VSPRIARAPAAGYGAIRGRGSAIVGKPRQVSRWASVQVSAGE
jgi:hypothetical protein